MIKIKVFKLNDQKFINAFKNLSENDKLGASIMPIVRVTKKILEEYESFEKAKLSIYKKFGNRINDQYVVRLDELNEQDAQSFNSEIEALFNMDIDLPIEEKIKVNFDCGLRPIDFVILDEIIEVV